MTQDDAAKHIGVSRPTFVQNEAGKRSVSSLDLDKFAYLFSHDIREFVANELQATALAVTPAELETALRGPSSRPVTQSGGRPEDGSRGRGSPGDRAEDLGE